MRNHGAGTGEHVLPAGADIGGAIDENSYQKRLMNERQQQVQHVLRIVSRVALS